MRLELNIEAAWRVERRYLPHEDILKPQRVSVLLNVSSGTVEGTGRDRLLEQLKAAFDKQGISALLAFVPGPDLRPAAQSALQQATQGELDAIIVGGGDGSISTVAGVLAGSGVALGILPLGTLNHFAKDLNIPPAIEEAVAIMGLGETRAVDVGEVNGRIFINNSSIGLYPYIVLDRDRRRRLQGLPKWFAMVLAALRTLRYFPIHRLRIRIEGRDEPYRSPCVFVGNNVYGLTGPSLGSRERLDEGQLCVYVAKPRRMIGLLWLACRCVIGLLDLHRDLRIGIHPAVEVVSRHRRLLVARDGEVEVMRSPLRYRIKPAALRVFAPAPENV